MGPAFGTLRETRQNSYSGGKRIRYCIHATTHKQGSIQERQIGNDRTDDDDDDDDDAITAQMNRLYELSQINIYSVGLE